MVFCTKALGIVLAFVGIVLIGFFNVGSIYLGEISFPFAEYPQSFFGWFGLSRTLIWWNTALWGLLIGFFGVLLMKYS